MSGAEGEKTPRRIQPPNAVLIIPLMIGLIGFYRVAQSPAFESYRTMDVVQLLVSGAGLGVALVLVMLMLLQPQWTRSEAQPTAQNEK